MQAWGDERGRARPGALDDRERPTHDDYFTFADLDETGTTSRSVFADVEPVDERFGQAWADDAEADDEPPRPQPARSRREPDDGYRPQRTVRPPSGGDRDMGMADRRRRRVPRRSRCPVQHRARARP